MTKTTELAARIAADPKLAAMSQRQMVRELGVSMGTAQRAIRLARTRPRVEAPSLVPGEEDLQSLFVAALEREGTLGRAFRSLGITRKKAIAGIDMSEMDIGGITELPARGVYLVTWAQDDTPIDPKLWENMQAYAASRNGFVVVCPGTYQKGMFKGHGQTEVLNYPPAIRPHILTRNVELFPGLQLVTTANVLPTTSKPLNGYDTHGGGDSLLIPSARQHLRMAARMLEHRPKEMWSTGAITVPNYVHRAAGQRAAWHHTLGFLVVERDRRGNWHVRRVTANADGSFQDLFRFVAGGEVVTDQATIEAMNVGDVHAEQADPVPVFATFGIDLAGHTRIKAGIVHELRPKKLFLQDILDFKRRGHHDRGDVRNRLQLLVEGRSSVEGELRDTAWLLKAICRSHYETVVVHSNHDDALTRWLRSADALDDEENVGLWHSLNAEWAAAIRRREPHNPVRHALERHGTFANCRWPERFSSVTMDFPSGPVEFGLHGDKGTNGARGSPAGFARAAPKTSTAHSHTPFADDGATGSGHMCRPDMGYNRGLTTSAWGHVIFYPSGHSTPLIIKGDGSWRA